MLKNVIKTRPTSQTLYSSKQLGKNKLYNHQLSVGRPGLLPFFVFTLLRMLVYNKTQWMQEKKVVLFYFLFYFCKLFQLN